MSDITIDQARRVLEAALAYAVKKELKMNIAVVDAGANLKAFVRMDGAWLGSIDISIKKARTARFFDMPSGEIGKLSQPGGDLYAIEHSNGGLITFPGGHSDQGRFGYDHRRDWRLRRYGEERPRGRVGRGGSLQLIRSQVPPGTGLNNAGCWNVFSNLPGPDRQTRESTPVSPESLGLNFARRHEWSSGPGNDLRCRVRGKAMP